MTRVLALAALVLVLGCDDGRPDRAPFLCCVLTCTGSFVEAEKEAPTRVDAGFFCRRGLPIEYDGTCSTDDGLECEDDNDQEETPGGTTDAGTRDAG